jgi:hypothetical protein
VSGLLKALCGALFLIGTMTPVMAQSVCQVLDQMKQGSFDPELPSELAHSMQCSTSRGLSGQQSQHCRWPFGFRAAEATTAFEELSDQVAACLGVEGQQPGGSDVNHPDTYHQRLFDLPDARISVALKDKGALQQIFVFLRVDSIAVK